jgi:hypothetical protein
MRRRKKYFQDNVNHREDQVSVKKTKLQYEKEKKYFQDNVNHHEDQVNEAASFFSGKAIRAILSLLQQKMHSNPINF